MSDEQDLNTNPSSGLRPPFPTRGEGKIELQNEELVDLLKRTAADFENFKKRKESESAELLQFAKEITVSKLMPSLQNLEQVLKYAPNDDKYKDWLAGLKATIM